MTRTLKIALCCAAAAAACLSGCGQKEEGRGGRGPRSGIVYPVEVEVVRPQKIVFTVNAVGSVEAYEEVQVTSRVAGVVDRVLFTEGSYAAVSQVLVEIETERYRLAVEAAKAAFAKAEAAKADAEAGLARRESVVKRTPGLIPAEEIETWRTKVLVSASEVAQTRAALDQAELNLQDAYVKAPFSGIVQTRTVRTGQYVQTGTVLATLVRRNPLLLRFRVSERDAARMRRGMTALFTVRDDPRKYEAKIVHVAEAADPQTRLVEITGEVRDTKERSLRPGSFAEISVPIGSEGERPVVPQTAVRPSERGFVSFIVQNGKAAERTLTVGMRTADGLIEVLSGLSVGDSLVVRGGEALREGVSVRIAQGEAEGQAGSQAEGKKQPQ